MPDSLRAVGVVGATVAACVFGAIIGTTGVIAWASWDVLRKRAR